MKRNQIKLTSPEKSLDLHDYFKAKLQGRPTVKTRVKGEKREKSKVKAEKSRGKSKVKGERSK